MAFNLQTFKTRTLTAIVFAVVMVSGLLWNQWSFIILFTIIHFGCWWEFFKVIEKIYDAKIDAVIKVFFAICGFTLMIVLGFQHFESDIFMFPFGFKLSGKWMLWIFEVACLLIFATQNNKISTKAKRMSFAGLLYISLPIALIIYLRTIFGTTIIYNLNTNNSVEVSSKIIPCMIIFSIWINDTMAYIVGSLIGKTPFSKISAKKTWEGTIGGIVLCVAAIALISWWLNFNVAFFSIIAGICAIFGTLGDLLESKLKRMAGVKDSGSLMPGHGGFLDRFDSLLIAIPFVWLYVYFFMR